MTRSLASLLRLSRFHASAPDLVPSALIANQNLRNLVFRKTGPAPLPAPVCYKQAHPATNGYCDCWSAVCRSPPLGSPFSSNTVPVVPSSYCARASFSRLAGIVTYFAAFTSRSRFSGAR
jgi:hypothetical protein